MTPISYFLLSLLWLSHGLVDRLGLSEQRARARGSAALWAAHAVQLGLLAAALLLFGLTRLRFSSQPMPPTLAELGLLAVAFATLHLLTDLAQMQLSRGETPSPGSESLDQLAHLGLSLAGVMLLGLRHPEWSQLGSGPILILGQPVELSRFASFSLYAALLIWIIGAALRVQLPTRTQALLAAERVVLVGMALAGPLWLAPALLAGRAAWALRAGEDERLWQPSLCVLLMAAVLRVLGPAG